MCVFGPDPLGVGGPFEGREWTLYDIGVSFGIRVGEGDVASVESPGGYTAKMRCSLCDPIHSLRHVVSSIVNQKHCIKCSAVESSECSACNYLMGLGGEGGPHFHVGTKSNLDAPHLGFEHPSQGLVGQTRDTNDCEVFLCGDFGDLRYVP